MNTSKLFLSLDFFFNIPQEYHFKKLEKSGGGCFLSQIQDIFEILGDDFYCLDLSKPPCRQKGKHYSHSEGVKKENKTESLKPLINNKNLCGLATFNQEFFYLQPKAFC